MSLIIMRLLRISVAPISQTFGVRCLLCRLFFFFQAEDGIRDVAVTGVQTCALPISPAGGARAGLSGCGDVVGDRLRLETPALGAPDRAPAARSRRRHRGPARR